MTTQPLPIPHPRRVYPARRGLRGHRPDCPYWNTHLAGRCPACRGEMLGDRAEERRAASRSTLPLSAVPPPVGLVPAPVDLTALDRPGEQTACTGCFAPHDGPAGTVCARCEKAGGTP